MKQKTSILTILFALLILTSCKQITNKVDEKINLLNTKVEQLDSMVNHEVNKVMALDSLINLEGDKVKKLDSLIDRSTTRIDSIAQEKVSKIKNILQ